jgi:hypothetical protein
MTLEGRDREVSPVPMGHIHVITRTAHFGGKEWAVGDLFFDPETKTIFVWTGDTWRKEHVIQELV